MTFLHHYPLLCSWQTSIPACPPADHLQPQGERVTIAHLMPPLLPQKKEPGPRAGSNLSHIKSLLRGRGGVTTKVLETSRNPVI